MKRDQPEEDKVIRKEEVDTNDQDGYELIKMPRRSAQYMPEIFAVDAEGSGGSTTKELLRPKSAEAKPSV